MARNAVQRRMRSLAVGEAVNVALLPALLLAVLDMPTTAANLTGLGLTLAILVEGSVYWALKRRQLGRGDAAPSGLTVFRWVGRGNVAALAIGFVVIAAGMVSSPGFRSWPGLALWLFAVVEHVNYFHVQLMHDTRADLGRLVRQRRLRRSSLARDLARSR